MNVLIFDNIASKAAHYVRATVRFLDPFRRANAFSGQSESKTISQIHVINLDRKPKRWRRMQSELNRFRGHDGMSLKILARRFPAIDARYLTGQPSPSVLLPRFTLAEQLSVNPNPLLEIDGKSHERYIKMTKPEIAIALSHIEVWRLIATGEAKYSLILEDDVMMRPGFAHRLNREWPSVIQDDFELLYLAYHDVNKIQSDQKKHAPSRRTQPGLWEASAYVLSKAGAQKLLRLLPANGPIDLWLNFVFNDLKIFTTARPIMEQRLIEPSTNSYSVLPVLSQLGVITREKPLIPESLRLPNPIVVIGNTGTGTSSVGLALMMLGYRVVSNVNQLPPNEQRRLEIGHRKSVFNAYVNVGSVQAERLIEGNRKARLIITDDRVIKNTSPSQTLRLTREVKDKWGALTDFLGLEYPSHPYPKEEDQKQFKLQTPLNEHATPTQSHDLKWDRSPWIVPKSEDAWFGIPVTRARAVRDQQIVWTQGKPLSDKLWTTRNDTFPSNLALFCPANVVVDGVMSLTLNASKTSVRDYAAGAVALQRAQLYGTYTAELRPARGSGVITGLFLHRNGPRQEIDIELRGRDTTKMLINVFYNPGPIDTKLEYGYRGTPTEINLGFDAADDFHLYEIDWQPELITWKVDGRVVYSRTPWNPTPIPDRPLEFNINIWSSRSVEFAGSIDSGTLPATTTVRSINIS
jgi:GR25 family glycosyltransferase involved in LPS biosynthesis